MCLNSMRIIGVINTNAGNYCPKEIGRLRDHLNKSCNDGELFEVSTLDDAEYVCRTNKADAYAIGGGDGTLAKTLSMIDKHDSTQTIIPLAIGTMNNLSQHYNAYHGLEDRVKRALCMKSSAEDVFCQVLNGEYFIHQMQPLKVNNDLGFNVGTGIVHDLLYNFNETQGFFPGRVLRTITKSLSAQCNDIVRLDNSPVQCTGMYASIYPRASLGLKRLTVKMLPAVTKKVDVAATTLSPYQLLMHAPFTPFKLLPGTQYTSVDKIDVPRDVQYQIDGDTYQSQSLHITRARPFYLLSKI